jgi:hypothetical protein
MSSNVNSTHLITANQNTYKENFIRINAGNGISEDPRVITQRVRQGCTLSSVFLIYILTKLLGFGYRKYNSVNILRDNF